MNLLNKSISERIQLCQSTLDEFRTIGLKLPEGDRFVLQAGKHRLITKAPFIRLWNCTVPASSPTEIMIWSPLCYMDGLNSAYGLKQSFGEALYSCALFLARSCVAYRTFGRIGLEKLAAMRNDTIEDRLEEGKHAGYSDIGLYLVHQLGTTLAWGIFEETNRERFFANGFQDRGDISRLNSCELVECLNSVEDVIRELPALSFVRIK